MNEYNYSNYFTLFYQCLVFLNLQAPTIAIDQY